MTVYQKVEKRACKSETLEQFLHLSQTMNNLVTNQTRILPYLMSLSTMTRSFVMLVHFIVYFFMSTDTVVSFYNPSNRTDSGTTERERDEIFQSSQRLTMDELHALTLNARTTFHHRKLSNTKLDNILTDLINSPNRDSTVPFVRTVGDKVLVTIVGTSSKDGEIDKILATSGYKVTGCYDLVCSIYVPVDKLNEIAAFPQVLSIRASLSMTQQSIVVSEGVFALYVDKAVVKYKVNGTGITIGVLSDSFNCLNQANHDIKTGNLPPLSDINVLVDVDDDECEFRIDEGRAMMQLIYDVAPGAKLAFRTAARGIPDFANGIRELADAGCDIIVDDVGYLDDSFFQDGLVAQAVDDVASQGVSYFSAAGNSARNAWDEPYGFFRSGIDFGFGEFHKFETSSDGSPIVSQRIRFSSTEENVLFIFQWDEPHFSVSGGNGCANDVDIFLSYNDTVVAESFLPNVRQDPLEVLFFSPVDLGSKESYVFVDMYITLSSGAPPRFMKIMAYSRQEVLFEFGDGGSTIFAHRNAALAAGVGAADYSKTTVYGISPPIVRSYSSVGGTPILIDKFGIRQDKEIRNQPLFTGPDGTLTTFFPPFPGTVNRFHGTSAAAPHVAAVAALLLEANGGPNTLPPKDLYKILQESAMDMDDPLTVGFDFGFDFKTGSGFINALGALDAISCNLSWNLFNSNTDSFVAPLINNTVISKPPPCNSTNIEVVVPCGTSKPVVIELYQGTSSRLIRRQSENTKKYFLFGNAGSNVFNGRITPGTYSIRAMVNGINSLRTTFVIGDGTSN